MCTPGLCGKQTAKKQNIFTKFVDHQMTVIEQIYNGRQWYSYLLYDLFAGPGYIVCNDGYEGPVGAIKVIELAQLHEFIIEVVAAEIKDGRREGLKSVMTCDTYTIHKDARQCLPVMPHPKNYGLVYIDPPMDKEGFEIVRDYAPKFAEMLPKCDILMYLSATYFKRFNGAPQVKFKEEIIAIMNATDKKYWFVSEVGGRNRYVFILGSNFDNWANYSGINMHSVNTYEGQRVLDTLHYEYTEPRFETYGMIQAGF